MHADVVKPHARHRFGVRLDVVRCRFAVQARQRRHGSLDAYLAEVLSECRLDLRAGAGEERSATLRVQNVENVGALALELAGNSRVPRRAL
jgi:hypothetical protein